MLGALRSKERERHFLGAGAKARETNQRFFANPVRLESGSETVWAVQMEQDGADGAWWIPALHQREIVVWELTNRLSGGQF